MTKYESTGYLEELLILLSEQKQSQSGTPTITPHEINIKTLAPVTKHLPLKKFRYLCSDLKKNVIRERTTDED